MIEDGILKQLQWEEDQEVKRDEIHQNCMDYANTTEFIMSQSQKLEKLESKIRQMIADYDTELEYNMLGVKSIKEVIERLEEVLK